MRRNHDEKTRDLERRAAEGDRQAALSLWREQNRSGIERPDHDTDVFLVDTSLGQVALYVYNERTIAVRIGESDVPVGSGSRERRKKVTLPPMVINRVPCRGYVTYHYYDEADFAAIVGDRNERSWTMNQEELKRHVPGFAPFSIETEGRPTSNIQESIRLKRADRNYGLDDASDSAKERVLSVLTPIVNKWAADNKRAMLEAERSYVSNQIASRREEYEKAIAALQAEEAKIADLVIREIQVRNELRR